MATGTAQVNGTYTANISKVDSVAVANIASINGITWASNAGTIYNNVIDYSCMFDKTSDTYLSYNAGAVDNDTSLKIKTFSVWVKRSALSASSDQCIFGGYFSGNLWYELTLDANDKLEFACVTSGTYKVRYISTAVFRDCSGWYHFLVALDTTQATEADRVKIYANGTELTAWDTQTEPALNADVCYQTYSGGAGVPARIGDLTTTQNFIGYLADAYIIDGQARAVTDFGEFSDGVWVPKDPTGLTYGNEGIKLDFSINTHFGDDTSGNANDYTDNNFGTDHQVSDTPEANYCTLDWNNRFNNASATLEEGGLSYSWADNSWTTAMGTFPLKTGKWYWEVDIGAAQAYVRTGVEAAGEYSGDLITAAYYNGQNAVGWGIASYGASAVNYLVNNAGTTADDNLDNTAANDILTVAVDCDNNKIWFGKYNAGSGHVWGDFGATGVGDPAAGTNEAGTPDFTLYDYAPVVSLYSHSTSTANFGQRSFTGTIPSGFAALCTTNMTDPVVNDPQDSYLNAVTYTGDGAADQDITGVGFQPDFVWIKNTDATDEHLVFDDQRGATKYLSVDVTATSTEQTDADTLLTFDADGFSVGADVKVNTSSEVYRALCLKETSLFFDIVTYTGTGSAHAESHSLGAAPTFIMVKNRDVGDSWAIYHHGALNKTDPETDYGVIDTAAAWSDAATLWNDVAPTTTQFTVGTSHQVNASTEKYVAYLFGDVDGISKAFTFEGNGNAAGPYVYCGFRPEWILIKNADSAVNWALYDTAMDTDNPLDQMSVPNVNNADSTTTFADICANGFKVRSSSSNFNGNNNTIIGIALSHTPYKWATAR
jgi:hypothetical protein